MKAKKLMALLLALLMLVSCFASMPVFAADETVLTQLAKSEILKFDFDAEDFVKDADGNVTGVKGIANGTEITAAASGVAAATDADGNAVVDFPTANLASNAGGITWTPGDADPMKTLTQGGGVTIAMWIKPAQDSFGSSLFSYGATKASNDGLGASLQMYGSTNRANSFFCRDQGGDTGGFKANYSSNPYTTGKWALVTYVESANGNVAFYVDGATHGTHGAADGKTLYAFANDTNADAYYIGNLPHNSNGDTLFNGQIDEVVVYNKALTADEINALYKVKYPISAEEIAAAQAVVTQIAALPAATAITADDEAAIVAARTAYAALTDLAKVEVTNLAVLEAAEAALATVKFENGMNALKENNLVLEAEAAVLSGSNIKAKNAGTGVFCSGNQYVGDAAAANTLTWTVYSATGGVRDVTVRYNGGQDRAAQFAVNGNDPVTFTLNSTGDWDTTFASFTTQITLEPGINNIVMQNPNGWMNNIDYIAIAKSAGDSITKDYFHITTSAAFAGNVITWGTQITPADGVTVDQVNNDIVFQEYGAIYGVDADAVNACIVNGGNDVVEEGVTMARSYKFQADQDQDEGIVVYDNFSFRLTGVSKDASRAATIYVKYSIGDNNYIAYSNISSIDTAAE